MKRFLLMALATLSLTAVQAQQHWGEQNNGQHKEKNPCGVSNR